jgi:Protein of unknown function (DUF4230)
MASGNAAPDGRPSRALWAVAGGLAVFVAALFIAAGAWLGRYTAPSARHIADTSTVVTQVQSMAQLVTVTFVMEKVVKLDDVKWYGQNRLLMIAHGVARAGVDLKKLRPEDVRARGDRLEITLPKPQLFDVYLDDRKTEVIERSTGILRTYDDQMETDARREALDQIRLAARAGGILEEARERARIQLSALATSAGFTAVDVRFQ